MTNPHLDVAVQRAVAQIEPNTIVGLGSGTTAELLLDRIGERWRGGELPGLRAVPTSEHTAARAAEWDLPLLFWREVRAVDLALDGADEVDRDLNLLKGRGGALLREKHVARAARKLVIVVDHHKLVDRLGRMGPLPVEVEPRAWWETAARLMRLGASPRLRGGPDTPFVTDNGNHILDLVFPGGIAAPYELAAQLEHDAGVREHGLFLGMTHEVIVAGPAGVRTLRIYGEAIGPVAKGTSP